MVSGSMSRLNSVFFIDANNGYIAGDNGTILNTNDGGINWSGLVSGTISDLHSICFPSLDTGYVVGDNGTILKTTNGGGVGINQSFSSSSTIKIYPIPTRDLLNVEIEAISGFATISIYKTNGQLVLEKMNISTKNRIDLRSLSPAVYFIKLTDEQNVYVRKIIKV